MFSYVCWALAFLLLWRLLAGMGSRNLAHQLDEEERAKWLKTSQRDPTNAGAHARLAEWDFVDGNLDDAIHHWRTAIGLLPQGPFTTEWKRKLKSALELQAMRERGEKIAGFHEVRACDKCEATMPANSKTCPRCGAVVRMDVMEFFTQPEVARSLAKETATVVLILFVLGTVFSSLPLEWKGCVLVSTAIVGAWYFLRAMDGNGI
jgi:uncharacterized paraquat-inducible protein A